jgi:hypothetical protein
VVVVRRGFGFVWFAFSFLGLGAVGIVATHGFCADVYNVYLYSTLVVELPKNKLKWICFRCARFNFAAQSSRKALSNCTIRAQQRRA